MPFPRLPRFKRSTKIAPIRLTKRDLEILRHTHRHRFLRSHQISALVGGSPQQTLRRLQLLYHHGYLERPRAQITYYAPGGSRHIVYGLGKKGVSALKRECDTGFSGGSRSHENDSIGRLFLAHALLVSDVMVAIELACRQNGRVRLIHQDELLALVRRRQFKWRVNISRTIRLGVVPDQVFALEYSGQDGSTDRAYYFLEADRGTMPVTRRKLSQTSFHRKLLAYEATWAENLHHTRFGFHRFRVLTVTTNAMRMKSIMAACSRLERGRGLFLFSDRIVLDRSADILSPIWQTAIRGETASLLD